MAQKQPCLGGCHPLDARVTPLPWNGQNGDDLQLHKEGSLIIKVHFTKR
jgi:hypothetical protein